MGSNQLCSLTWGEFGTSLASTVQLLRCHEDLVDVTLAAGGRSFPAHKIVLSAASPFLLNLLKSTPCEHPVVLLAGVTATDLEALLEFVYRGEVSVGSNQLPSFLQAAHCLNIQGLTPGTSAEKSEDVPVVSTAHEALTRDVITSFLPVRRRKHIKRRDSSSSGGKWPRQESVTSVGEIRPTDQQNSVPGMALVNEQPTLNISDATQKIEGTETNLQMSEVESYMATSVCTGGGILRAASDQPGACPVCGATLKQARNLRRHLLTGCKYRMFPQLLHQGYTTDVRQSSQQIVSKFPVPSSSLLSNNNLDSPSCSSLSTFSQPSEHIICQVSPPTSSSLSNNNLDSASCISMFPQPSEQIICQVSPSSSLLSNSNLDSPSCSSLSTFPQPSEHIICQVSPPPSPLSSSSNLVSPTSNSITSAPSSPIQLKHEIKNEYQLPD